MSWLFFIDESGHDHKSMPYEVRGGISIHVSKIWPFVKELGQFERHAFGAPLVDYSKEVKGSSLLDEKRFRFAQQKARFSDEVRQKQCRRFLTKGLEKKPTPPTREEFTAYGQACLKMAEGAFQLMEKYGVVLFATAIPRGVQGPKSGGTSGYFRKDLVFLLERFFYHLEEKGEHGILVFDEIEKHEDRRFLRRLERYFTKTEPGRHRSQWVVPTPFFVSSEMTYAVQAADLAIYCINWGFRIPGQGMNEPTRPEIASRFRNQIGRLQFKGQGERNGRVFETFGIVYIPDPYDPRR